MPQMTPVVLSYHRNTVVKNFQSHFFHTHSWTLSEKEALPNMSPMVSITPEKWNYYLQESEIIMCNDHKPLEKFLNGKNMNNRVNQWSLELTTCNITFKWIAGA